MAGNPTVSTKQAAKGAGKLAGMTVGKVAMIGMDVFGVVSTYKDSRDNGHGVMFSAGAAAVDQALWFVAPQLQWARMGLQIAGAIGEGVKSYAQTTGKENAQIMNNQYGKNFGGRYQDTTQSYTMRQRGMQAIQNSGAKSVLGSEARTYFRGVY